jgi:hypothetical protein
MCKLSTDDLAENVRADIAEGLRAALEFPVDRHIIQLTGGKDSRLILAVALWAGLAHEFEYETVGPPGMEDVNVASDLATLLRLRHEVRFVGLGSQRPFADRIHDFVRATGGMLNVWDLADPQVDPNEMRVVGICGEMLRTYRHLMRAVRSPDDLLALFRAQDFGRLGLVYPDVARRLHRTLLDVLFDDPSRRAEPLDLLDAFYFKNRVRFSRTGPREELPSQLRMMPLYSIRSLRVAFALGGKARQLELLHYEVIRRCSDLLANHSFAGHGWDPAFSPASSGAVKPEALMASLQVMAFDERKQIFLSVLDDQNNAAWDVIDRRAALSALERFPALRPAERRELYGAMTAALWLSEANRL